MDTSVGSYLGLSSGRRIYVYGQRLGISPNLDISGGYDQELLEVDYTLCDECAYTIKDSIEIADYAIGLWQQFRARQVAKLEGK